MGTSTAQVRENVLDSSVCSSTFIVADCTLGQWGDWVCQASNGSCGNGTLYRQKVVLYPERNGGVCLNKAEEGESCIKDCKLLSEKSTGNTSTGILSIRSFWDLSITSKFIILGAFIGVGASIFVIVVLALIAVWKKPQILDSLNKTRKPNILLPVEKDSSNRESIIYKI